jgi:hypothetical protein
MGMSRSSTFQCAFYLFLVIVVAVVAVVTVVAVVAVVSWRYYYTLLLYE